MCRDCNELYICEVCSVDGDHKTHDVLNLRPLVIEIMKKFEDNVNLFQQQYMNVTKSRASEYRDNVYREINQFFTKIHEVVDVVRRQKEVEVDEVFRKTRIDDLSDMKKYSELRQNVDRALQDMQGHYRELAFSKIFMNRESIKKIDKAIVEISAHLKHTHSLFDQKC